jgi:GNAT superfamily N-acetyltransferase
VNRDVEIRRATPDDADALASLAFELGYEVCPDEIPGRLAGLPESDEVLVATDGGEVVGWIHLAVQRSLLVAPRVTVEGVVVRETRRGEGIGKRLIACADGYARRRGLTAVVLRSNVVRKAAHGFYRSIGFEERKRSAVFERRVPADAPPGSHRDDVAVAGTSDGPTGSAPGD